MRIHFCIALLAFCANANWVAAQTNPADEITGDSFLGHWITAQKDGVVSLQRCSIGKGMPPTAICGIVTWDNQVDNPKRTIPLDCNRQVLHASKFSAGVWSEGLAFDPRTRRSYQTKLRLKDGKLHVRSFMGNEMFGETEVFTRIDKVPLGCEGKTPESLKSNR